MHCLVGLKTCFFGRGYDALHGAAQAHETPSWMEEPGPGRIYLRRPLDFSQWQQNMHAAALTRYDAY